MSANESNSGAGAALTTPQSEPQHPLLADHWGSALPGTPLAQQDPDVAESIRDEVNRQLSTLELIASENFPSPAVLQANGTVLNNKYAEGYPGRRYYGGCEFVDVAERLARNRAKELFGAEAVNVQPHSGAQANAAVFLAFLKPGDNVLGLRLDHGGHLTHGHPKNFSGLTYNCHAYSVRKEDQLIDMDEAAALAREHKPKLIITGASCYARTWDFAKFREIADEVGALLMCDMAHYAGLIAGGAFPSPVPHCDIVTTTVHKTLRGPRSGMILMKKKHAKAINSAVFPGIQGGPLMHVIAAKAVCFGEALKPSFKAYAAQVVKNAKVLGEKLTAEGLRLMTGGTDSHVLAVDVTSVGSTGKIAEEVLERAGITCNKNMIPYDERPPMDPSGIRLGTPALTTRGMGEAEMEKVGGWIVEALKNADDEAALERIRGEVFALTSQYPLYNADAWS